MIFSRLLFQHSKDEIATNFKLTDNGNKMPTSQEKGGENVNEG